MVLSVEEHFGSEYERSVRIGVDPRGVSIDLSPSSMKMEYLAVDDQNDGWWPAHLLLTAARYLNRNTQHVQFIDGFDFNLWVQGSLVELPKHEDVNTVPIVFLPYNEDNEHWTLFIFNFDTRIWEHLDSLNRGIPNGIARMVVTNIGHQFAGWKQGKLVAQKQENKADCGLWVVANIKAYAVSYTAAGPQRTAGLRLWLSRILTDALLNVAGPYGRRTSAPDWVNEDMDMDIAKQTTQVGLTTQGHADDSIKSRGLRALIDLSQDVDEEMSNAQGHQHSTLVASKNRAVRTHQGRTYSIDSQSSYDDPPFLKDVMTPIKRKRGSKNKRVTSSDIEMRLPGTSAQSLPLSDSERPSSENRHVLAVVPKSQGHGKTSSQERPTTPDQAAQRSPLPQQHPLSDDIIDLTKDTVPDKSNIKRKENDDGFMVSPQRSGSRPKQHKAPPSTSSVSLGKKTKARLVWSYD